MQADVAIGERAEDRIGEGMERDVAVGMADDAPGMLDCDAAEHDLVARSEGVDVVARADPDVAEGQRGLGQFTAIRHGEVLRCGDLDVGRVARHDPDGNTRPLGDGGVVGEVVACGGGLFVRLEDEREAEALGRLGGLEAGARHRAGDPAGGIDRLQGRRDGQGGDDGLGRPERCDDAADHGSRHEGPRRVVDQHTVGRRRGKGAKSKPYRLLARCAAGHRRKQGRVILRRNIGIARVIGRRHHDDGVDVRMGEEGVDRAPEHRNPAYRPVLLRYFSAGPNSSSGGDDHCCGSRHRHPLSCFPVDGKSSTILALQRNTFGLKFARF